MAAEPTPGATPEREWSADEVKRGLELFHKGTSIRKLAAELGVSRHQAERFLSECRAALTPTPPIKVDRSAFRAGRLFPDDDRAPAPVPPHELGSPRAEHEFETLQRTRQELKSKLDRSAQMGDRAGVATYSLAIARLNSTDDPGATNEAVGLDFSGVPDAVLWFMGMALPALRERAPGIDGEPKPSALTAQQQA